MFRNCKYTRNRAKAFERLVTKVINLDESLQMFCIFVDSFKFFNVSSKSLLFRSTCMNVFFKVSCCFKSSRMGCTSHFTSDINIGWKNNCLFSKINCYVSDQKWLFLNKWALFSFITVCLQVKLRYLDCSFKNTLKISFSKMRAPKLKWIFFPPCLTFISKWPPLKSKPPSLSGPSD